MSRENAVVDHHYQEQGLPEPHEDTVTDHLSQDNYQLQDLEDFPPYYVYEEEEYTSRPGPSSFENENSEDHSSVEAVPSLPDPMTLSLPRKWEHNQAGIQTVAGEFTVPKWTPVTADDDNNPETNVDPDYENNIMTGQTHHEETLPLSNISVAEQAAKDFARYGRESEAKKSSGSSVADHPDVRNIPCSNENCTKTFRDRALMRKHVRCHRPRPHVCELCGKMFVDKSKLKRHHTSHTGEKHFQCPNEGCGRKFSLKYNLKKHMTKCQCAGKVAVQTDEEHDYDVTQVEQVLDDEMMPCENAVVDHHHQEQGLPELHEDTVTDHLLPDYYQLQDLEKFQIEYVHEEEVYTSSQGPSRSGRESEAKKSSGSSVADHPDVRNIPCSNENCTKTFRDRALMQKHAKWHGPRPHVCELCGRGFVDKSNLKRHHIYHTGEKNFQCPNEGCGRKFSLKYNLKKHMTTCRCAGKVVEMMPCENAVVDHHHQEQGLPELHEDTVTDHLLPDYYQLQDLEKFQIEYVHEEEVYTSSQGPSRSGRESEAKKSSGSSVADHPDVRNIPCSNENCTKTFHDRALMQKHAKYHGPRPHVCELCGKGFVDKSNLKRHHISHTGEKNFQCPNEGCGRKCSLKYNLKKHMTTCYARAN